MTAPDVNADVRARFEAEFSKPPFELPMPRWGGSYRTGQYQDYNTQCAWEGYRAHADMAGEVRELVEALQAARDHGAMTGDEWVIDKVDAALAKFHPTRQEKP